MTTPKRTGCLTAVLIVALIMSAVFNVAFLISRAGQIAKTVARPGHRSAFGEELVKPAKEEGEGIEKRVAVISVRGVISSAELGQVAETALEDTLAEIEQAREDHSVCAVVLRIDSPGGEVTASDILYNAVRLLREKKPVVVSMDSVAASGGYYVACAGSHLFAHETTITASIGVIMQSVNYRELLGKVGLEVMTFKSGALKDLLNGARELTDMEREYVQGMINQSYDRFVGIVARERHLDERELRQGVADGRIVSGVDALKEKLVDELGGMDEACEKARVLGKAPGASVIRYSAPMAFGRLMRLLSETSTKGSRVQLDWRGLAGSKLQNGRLYYLPSVLIP
ncbi:MAG: signal peptide peptidase SppA [Verrucomicrobiota bacterium]|jgi:protease-4